MSLGGDLYTDLIYATGLSHQRQILLYSVGQCCLGPPSWPTAAPRQKTNQSNAGAHGPKAIRSPTITRESSFHVKNLLSTPKCWYVRRRAGARRPTLRDFILQSKPYSPNPICLLLGPVPNTLSLSYPGYRWTRRRSYRSITTS